MKNPLDILLADALIDEVLGRLKSGKEGDFHVFQFMKEVVPDP